MSGLYISGLEMPSASAEITLRWLEGKPVALSSEIDGNEIHGFFDVLVDPDGAKDKRIKNQRHEIECLKNRIKKLDRKIKNLEARERAGKE